MKPSQFHIELQRRAALAPGSSCTPAQALDTDPELTPEPPQTTGAPPTARFRSAAERFQIAHHRPAEPDETVPPPCEPALNLPYLLGGGVQTIRADNWKALKQPPHKTGGFETILKTIC